MQGLGVAKEDVGEILYSPRLKDVLVVLRPGKLNINCMVLTVFGKRSPQPHTLVMQIVPKGFEYGKQPVSVHVEL